MYIKRKLSETLELHKSLRFPYTARNLRRNHRYQVTVGIGGNLGDVKRRFHHLLYKIERDKRVELLRTSLILKNPPFGYIDQDDFFNSIMILKTSMSARVFLKYMQSLEKKFGRKRSFANAPRTLDLDIIFFNNLVINTKELTVPHPKWAQRESVIIPLSSLSL